MHCLPICTTRMSVWIFLGAIFKYWLYFPPVIPVGVLAALWKRFCTLVNNMAISLWVLTTYGWVSSSFGVVVFILLILTAVSASLETLTKKLKLWKPLLNSRTLSTNVKDLFRFTRFFFISNHLLALWSLCSWPLKKELIVLSFPVSTGRLEGIMFLH